MSSASALLLNPKRWISPLQISNISGCRYLSRLDALNDKNGADESLPKQTSWQNPRSPIVDTLLQKTVSRATRTLSTTASGDWDDADFTKSSDIASDRISSVVDAAIIRSSSVLSEAADESTSTDINDEGNIHQDKRTYLNNPCVTPTALAHTLWKSTIIPYHDTVIDATCGNGKDCLALTKMMFPGKEVDPSSDVHPQLIGVDIQSRAIANTQRSLLSTLPEEVYYNHVTLLERSHEHLLDIITPREDGKKQQVGLVCYNLGYLPGGQASNDNYKKFKTQMQTTLNSITDAALLLRVGGLLSIMTYPGSNLEESIAVEHFVEGLAMLTTRDEDGWRAYLECIPDFDVGNDDESNSGSAVRDVVSRSIERVVSQGSPKQTWRSFVHKPLGRPLSPILVTAHRIK
jgi:SAM-dependent methyltransferase